MRREDTVLEFPDEHGIRELLDIARQSARSFGFRAFVGTIVLGAVMMLLGFAIALTLLIGGYHSSAVHLGLALVYPGAFALLLVITVDEVRALSWFLTAAASMSVVLFSYLAWCEAMVVMRGPETRSAEAAAHLCSVFEASKETRLMPCSFAKVDLALSLIPIGATLRYILVTSRLSLSRPRAAALLEKTVSEFALAFRLIGISYVLQLAYAAWLGLVRPTPFWVSIAVCGCETLLVSELIGQGVHSLRQSWLAGNNEAIRTAASTSSMLDGRSPAVVLSLARERFCAVRGDLLTRHAFESNLPDPALRALAVQLDGVGSGPDAFLSHAWDDDLSAKWSALEQWMQRFVAENGRPPLLWIDKYCIDQTNIADDLACLPIYLASCSTLLILAGPRWSTRLWCILEMHLWLSVCQRPINRIEVLEVQKAPPAAAPAPAAAARAPRAHAPGATFASSLSARLASWRLRLGRAASSAPPVLPNMTLVAQMASFDVRATRCSDSHMFERLLRLISAGVGGQLDEFNEEMREAVENAVALSALRLRTTSSQHGLFRMWLTSHPMKRLSLLSKRVSLDLSRRRNSKTFPFALSLKGGSSGSARPGRRRLSSVAVGRDEML